MAVNNRNISFDSLRSISALPGAGESLVLRCPGPTLASLAAHSMEKGLHEGKGYAVISGHPRVVEDSQSRLEADLSASRTLRDAIVICARSLREIPSRTAVILLFVRPLPASLGRPRALLKFFQTLRTSLTKSKRASLWIIADDLMPNELCASFIESSDYFFELSEVGSQIYGQFIKVRRNGPEAAPPSLLPACRGFCERRWKQ